MRQGYEHTPESDGIQEKLQNHEDLKTLIRTYTSTYTQQITYGSGEDTPKRRNAVDIQKFQKTFNCARQDIDIENETEKLALMTGIDVLKNCLDVYFQPRMINEYGLNEVVFGVDVKHFGMPVQGMYSLQEGLISDVKVLILDLNEVVKALESKDEGQINKAKRNLVHTILHELGHYHNDHQGIGVNNLFGETLVSKNESQSSTGWDYFDGILQNEQIVYQGTSIPLTWIDPIINTTSYTDFVSTYTDAASIVPDVTAFQEIQKIIREKITYAPTYYALTSEEEFSCELTPMKISSYLKVCESYEGVVDWNAITPGQAALIKLEAKTGCKIDPENTTSPFMRKIRFEERSLFPYSNTEYAKQRALQNLEGRFARRVKKLGWEGDRRTHVESIYMKVIESRSYDDVIDPRSTFFVGTEIDALYPDRGDVDFTYTDRVEMKLSYEGGFGNGPMYLSNVSRGTMGPDYWNALYSNQLPVFDDGVKEKTILYAYYDRYLNTDRGDIAFTLEEDKLSIKFQQIPAKLVTPKYTEETLNYLIENGIDQAVAVYFIGYDAWLCKYECSQGTWEGLNPQGDNIHQVPKEFFGKLGLTPGGSPLIDDTDRSRMKETILGQVTKELMSGFVSKERVLERARAFQEEFESFQRAHAPRFQGLTLPNVTIKHLSAFDAYKKAGYEWQRIGFDHQDLGSTNSVLQYPKDTSGNPTSIPPQWLFPKYTIKYLMQYPPQGDELLTNPFGQQLLRILGCEEGLTIKEVATSLTNTDISFLAFAYALARYQYLMNTLTDEKLTAMWKSWDSLEFPVDHLRVIWDVTLSIQDKKNIFQEKGRDVPAFLGSDEYRRQFIQEVKDNGTQRTFYVTLLGTLQAYGVDVTDWSRQDIGQGIVGLSPNGEWILPTAGMANYRKTIDEDEKAFGAGLIAYRNSINKRDNALSLTIKENIGDVDLHIVPYGMDGRYAGYPKDDISFFRGGRTCAFTFDGYTHTWQPVGELPEGVAYTKRGQFTFSKEVLSGANNLKVRVHTNSFADQRQAHVLSNCDVQPHVDVKSFVFNYADGGFESGGTNLSRGYQQRLDDNVVPELQNISPDTYLFITGHTDSDGDADENINLSYQRAVAVRTYLINQSHGALMLERCIVKGFGEKELLNDESTDKLKAKNRRVEIVIE